MINIKFVTCLLHFQMQHFLAVGLLFIFGFIEENICQSMCQFEYNTVNGRMLLIP